MAESARREGERLRSEAGAGLAGQCPGEAKRRLAEADTCFAWAGIGADASGVAELKQALKVGALLRAFT